MIVINPVVTFIAPALSITFTEIDAENASGIPSLTSGLQQMLNQKSVASLVSALTFENNNKNKLNCR
jgi:hypothetical protein